MPFAVADTIAICVFAAIGLTLLAAPVWLILRTPLKPAQAVLWWVNYLLTRLLWRTHIEGRLDLPTGQGAIIVANHRSSLDPCFIEALTQRIVHWMVAKEYCESPAFRWFLRTCEVIPTSRGGIDTAATKQAIRIAQAGGLVGIFPEGRINVTTDLLLPGRSGAVLVALRAGVPIVPCYIEGSPYRGTAWSPLLMPAHVRLIIGWPIDVGEFSERSGDREALDELTRRVLQSLAELGGRPDFTPKLAGRAHRAS